MEKLYVALVLFVLNVRCTFTKHINSEWPKDDWKQFPYPTPDPINIDPFKDCNPTLTPTPLKIIANPLLFSSVTNTGDTLLVKVLGNPPTIATGGVLYNDTYIFFERQFLWDRNLKHSAGATIDGFGTSLQAVVSFYNSKYGDKETAMLKRDGIFQVIVFIYVGSKPSILFLPFQKTLQSIKEYGSTIVVPESFSYIFYLLPSIRQDYYVYPGQYNDHKSGKTFFSSTVTLWRRFPPPTISYKQFNDTFCSLRNQLNENYSNIKSTFPKGPRPCKHVILSRIELIFY